MQMRVSNQIKNETHPICAGWDVRKRVRATHTPAPADNNTARPARSICAYIK